MKQIMKIALLALIVALSFAMVGCEWLLEVEFRSYDTGGKVVDVRTNEAIEEVTVKLYKGGDTTSSPYATSTSDSFGNFDFGQVQTGTYTLVASKDQSTSTENVYKYDNQVTWSESDVAYGFIDQTIEVTEATSTLRVLGLEFNTKTDDYAVSVILSWNDSFDDLDAILSYPVEGSSTVSRRGPTFYPYYNDISEATYAISPSDSFSPETGTTRPQIYYGNATSGGNSTYDSTNLEIDFGATDTTINGVDTYNISLDVDDTNGEGPETLTIRDVPWSAGGTDEVTDPFGDPAYWEGVMEFYAQTFSDTIGDATDGDDDTLGNSYTDASGTTYDGADATIYVVQTFADAGSGNPGADLLGKFEMPNNIQLNDASILRIHVFRDPAAPTYPYFVFYPDINLIDSNDNNIGNYRALDDSNFFASVKR